MNLVKRNMFNLLFMLLLLFFLLDFVFAKRGCCSHHGGVSGSCRGGKQVCNDGTTSPTCGCEDSGTYFSGNNSSNSIFIYGCTDSGSINYNSNATRDDGSCIKKVFGCMDVNAYNYNASANVDDGSCIDKIYGCIDKSANNYNREANTANGLCLYTKHKTHYEKIKYKTKYKYKFFAKKGKILTKGRDGKKKVEVELILNENGDVIKSTVVKSRVVKKPIAKVIVTKNRSVK